MTDFTLVITVPDAKATDILNTVTDHLGYLDPEGNDGQGTRLEYMRQQIRGEIKNIYTQAKEKQAHSAVDTAKTDAEAIDFT